MVENPDPNISFLFRVECDDTSCVKTQTFGCASESERRCVDETATKNAESNGRKAVIIRSRRYKVIQFVIRRITRRGKKKQKKPVRGVSVKTNKLTTEAQVTTEQDEVTFATQDLSIDAGSDSPLLDESPSTRQRKRFAGVWEDFEVARQIKAEQARAERRARTKSLSQWEEFKENVGPSIAEKSNY